MSVRSSHLQTPFRCFLLISAFVLTTDPVFTQLHGGRWETDVRVDGQYENAGLGAFVSGAGDINGDGSPDFAIASNESFIAQAGRVAVYSGRDHSLLYEFQGAPNDREGSGLAPAGDLNLDGFDDLLVGAAGASPSGIFRAGRVRVYSGKDGSILHEVHGLNAGDLFGTAVTALNDINSDNVPDFAASASYATPNNLQSAGEIRIYSGADAQLLATISGTKASQRLGWAGPYRISEM